MCDASFYRVMAIDAGDVRTGVAVSDATGRFIGDAFVITEKNTRKLVSLLTAEAKTRGVAQIVVGHPLNMNATAGPRAHLAAALAEALKAASGLPVTLWDERQTTVAAQKTLHTAGRHGRRNKQKVDAVAASLILESFLPSLRR